MVTRPMNIPEAFEMRAHDHPDKTALIYVGTRYSYHQLWSWAQSFAGSLADLSIGPGDKVMIYMPNCPQWVVACLGILMRGAAVVPLSPIYPARDLEFVANDSGATAIVSTNENFGYVSQIMPRTGITTAIHTNLTDLLPLWKKAWGVLFDKIPRGRTGRGKGIVSFSRMLKTDKPLTGFSDVDRSDLATILYTGGTTKAPKGVPYTHELLIDPVYPQLEIVEEVVPRGTNIIMMAAPLFHITGMTFGLATLYLSGETVILLPKLNPDALMDTIQREKAVSLFGVPSLYRMLLEHDRLDLYDLGSLKFCFSGGDVFPGQIGERWTKRFGMTIGQGYGATETVGGVSLTRPHETRPDHTVGRPLGSKRILIVDPETLDVTPSGIPGELLVGSEPMITEYWNRPVETSRAFIRLHGKMWYRTSDMMKEDGDGFLYFVDRVEDAIVVKGRRISVSELETSIQEHPAVTGACVVGVPDAEGDRIKAFVVLKENQRGLSGKDLMDWLEARLPEYMIPHHIEFRDVLPKSKVGKLLRRELRSESHARLEKGIYDEAADEQ